MITAIIILVFINLLQAIAWYFESKEKEMLESKWNEAIERLLHERELREQAEEALIKQTSRLSERGMSKVDVYRMRGAKGCKPEGMDKPNIILRPKNLKSSQSPTKDIAVTLSSSKKTSGIKSK